jgi:hypothetical protein
MPHHEPEKSSASTPESKTMPSENAKPTPPRNQVALEAMRLHAFLANNQLVQSNAIAQKLKDMLSTIVMNESKETKAEDHKYWKPLNLVTVIQSFILSGKTKEALETAIQLQRTI